MERSSAMLPNVEFSLLPISDEVGKLRYLLTHGKTNRLFNIYPELEKPDNPYSLETFLAETFSRNREKITTALERYKTDWKKIEIGCFSEMREIVGTDWSKNHPTIKAMISILPHNLRSLNSQSFTIFYATNPRRAMEIIAQECFPFLYFKKWKEVFPNTRPEMFEYPHSPWLLSELIAPIVLNDPRMQKFLRVGADFYPSHEKITIDGESAPQYFTKLYRKYSGDKNGFRPFLLAASKAMQAHQNTTAVR